MMSLVVDASVVFKWRVDAWELAEAARLFGGAEDWSRLI